MQPQQPTPPDWPRISGCAVYRDAPAAIDWLCRAFGFELRLRVEGEGGRIEHCELAYGDGLLMVAQEDSQAARVWKRALRSPQSLGGLTTQTLMIFVDDAEAHCAQARAAGAEIVEELAEHDYGEAFWCDRSYGARDPEGHVWWLTQRLRSPTQPHPALVRA